MSTGPRINITPSGAFTATTGTSILPVDELVKALNNAGFKNARQLNDVIGSFSPGSDPSADTDDRNVDVVWSSNVTPRHDYHIKPANINIQALSNYECLCSWVTNIDTL